MKVFEWLEARFEALGERIGTPFEVLTDSIEQNLQHKVTGAFKDLLEDYEQEMREPLEPFITEILKNEAIPLEIRKILEDTKEPPAFAFSSILAVLASLAVLPAAGASLSGGIERVRQSSMKKFQSALLSPDEVISAFWRGNINSDVLREELDKHGYTDDKKVLIEAVRRYIPNPQDLIQFTVRDVFREDIVQKYGYDEGFAKIVEDIRPWLRSAGMDEEVLKLYWRAHWSLPSISQAFEMMHRGATSLDNVRELLHTADVAPGWIEPLIKIAYSPYTRVDVRRMYDAGILTKEGVMKSYTDIGYDEEHATNLTDWTVAQSIGAERDLTKSEIIAAYKNGALNSGDAKGSLLDMGYAEDEADLIISLEDYKTESKILGREKGILIKHFARGDITVDELKKSLGDLGLSEREMSLTVEEARNTVRERTATPTKADLLKWFKLGIVDQDTLMSEMRFKGYSQEHIQNYIDAEG